MNKEPRYKEVVVDFVDRVHGTGSPEIRLWRPLSAFPVEFVDVVRGTDGSIKLLLCHLKNIIPLAEGLGKVLGQGIEPGCIAGCEDEADHE